jgi:SAM-dependent methyltransferase
MMRPFSVTFVAVVVAVTLAGASAAPRLQQAQRKPDVGYVPTPQAAVDVMLELAGVTASDVVYDLGSGDGRIPITAARRHGARAVGIDIDPDRIAEANANAAKAGVTDRVRFLRQDLFESDISEATVVTLYLYPELNLKLLPKLNRELRPGTRVVSHTFDMGNIQPKHALDVSGRPVYLFVVPIE